MSTNATAAARITDRVKVVPDAERGRRLRLRALYILAFATNLGIFIYGFDYYKLSAIDRPFSPKHQMLRPSGPIGLYLDLQEWRRSWGSLCIRFASTGNG